ncbi:hypothetical protein Taro_005921 [Colocasia esculenta]|uniref:Yippee domain-containing protein n=1 Tax=Colocasia esculenta TaxID=4460 RepID=A0A843TR46_COLES|nr:hypothetical protein [Colocasia esculenta]
MTIDYPSPYWRLSEDPDWVAFKNDFCQLRDIFDIFTATLQRVVYKVDPTREDEHEEQPKEVHYVADPTLIEEYEEQMKEIHYVADLALEDEYYKQIESELSEADEHVPVEKHEPRIKEIVVDRSKPIVDATNLYDFDHIWSDIESFNCKHGKAYLFNKIRTQWLTCFDFFGSVNVSVGQKEERLMMTGVHTVADIFCVGCGSILGWKYEVAHEKCQKYKEGKFILERCPHFHFELTTHNLRCKVITPDCSHYCVSHDVQNGGSDADDA